MRLTWFGYRKFVVRLGFCSLSNGACYSFRFENHIEGCPEKRHAQQ